MASRFEWRGLAELKTALDTLGARLVREAGHLALAEANAAAVQIRSNYGAHRRTGRLQDSVRVDSGLANAGRMAYARVRVSPKYAAWVEFGTAGKMRVTKTGGRRGILPALPPQHQFFPVIFTHRRALRRHLALLLQREGLTPRGL